MNLFIEEEYKKSLKYLFKEFDKKITAKTGFIQAPIPGIETMQLYKNNMEYIAIITSEELVLLPLNTNFKNDFIDDIIIFTDNLEYYNFNSIRISKKDGIINAIDNTFYLDLYSELGNIVLMQSEFYNIPDKNNELTKYILY